MIIALVSLAIIFWLFYYLFIKGTVWPLLLIFFGIFGGRSIILSIFPNANKILITFASPFSETYYDVSWATFIAVIISILGIGVIMEKTDNE